MPSRTAAQNPNPDVISSTDVMSSRGRKSSRSTSGSCLEVRIIEGGLVEMSDEHGHVFLQTVDKYEAMLDDLRALTPGHHPWLTVVTDDVLGSSAQMRSRLADVFRGSRRIETSGASIAGVLFGLEDPLVLNMDEWLAFAAAVQDGELEVRNLPGAEHLPQRGVDDRSRTGGTGIDVIRPGGLDLA
jgi:hypothetical protein